jgi:hypothetical protein
MAHRNVGNALNLLPLSDHERTCPDLLRRWATGFAERALRNIQEEAPLNPLTRR